MQMMKLFTLVIVIAGIAVAESKPMTLCDLAEFKGFEGQLITVKGRILFSMHGAAFVRDKCKLSQPGIALLYPLDRTAPSVDFQLDSHAVEKLTPYTRSTGGVAIACATLTGQLAVTKKFRLRQYGGGPQGNGFGSRGTLRLAMVIKSVDQIEPCE